MNFKAILLKFIESINLNLSAAPDHPDQNPTHSAARANADAALKEFQAGINQSDIYLNPTEERQVADVIERARLSTAPPIPRHAQPAPVPEEARDEAKAEPVTEKPKVAPGKH